jgi:glycosyltransferase involved in cell wall biosynthesis
MSAGMQRYADELAARLPLVAPDLRFATLERDRTLDLDEQIGLPRRLRAAHGRLVHFLSVYAPLFFAPRPYVITIHDLIHLRFPEQFKPTVGPYYRTVVRSVCARAARVITDDERTVGDLERYLGVAPAKVRVVPLGVGPEFLESEGGGPQSGARPYFLYVGNHRPHKDLATLVSAWEKLPQELDVDLVLTGLDDLGVGTRQRSAGRTVRFAGDVGGSALRDLYRGALALVSPSLCEGFGLPLLEAAALGTPVIASSEAIPGTLRAYAEAFPPRDAGALAAAMARAASSFPARARGLTEEAQRFAQTQTWDRCAERTAEVYREVLEETEQR